MRRLPVLAALLWCTAGLSDEAAAQLSDPPEPLTRQAAGGALSSIVGLVTDEAGDAVPGASVFAMGAVLSAARTDDRGRFHLTLAPGAYILRAIRDGYISTYREAVEVRSDTPLRRNIMLLRAGASDVVLAAMTQLPPDAAESAVEPASPAPAAPSETVWRLRHLPRTVLRDQTRTIWDDDDPARADVSQRLALASIANADLSGHVDFLTTSALAASGDPVQAAWPRGIAYVVLGAPVGDYGNWSVRAALAGGEASAWTFTGEYASRGRSHAFRTGVSYSAQTMNEPGDRTSLAALDSVRRVGGVHISDEWAVTRTLRIDSGLKVARYDYLAQPVLVDGRLGVRQIVMPRITVVAWAGSHHVAPGADQFAPPASSGVWLPPERTFSALRGDLEPQHVSYYEGGADAALVVREAGEAGVVLRVRRFSERSSRQMATLFGLDRASQIGHYYISSPGDVEIDGWIVGVSSQLAPHVHATLDYTAAVAEWQPAVARFALRRAAASVARSGVERLHDLTATIHADVPATATRFVLAFRVNSGFSRHQWGAPGFDGRFAAEARQQLPVQPFGRGELNLVLSARTLLHAAEASGGFYDELLTVAPPVRLMCGLQMRF